MMLRLLKLGFALLLGATVTLAVLVTRGLVRLSPDDELLAHTDDPASDYEKSLARFAEMQVQEDVAVENGITRELVNRWRAAGYDRVQTYEFEASYHLIHDMIDPKQAEQQTALVYPVFLDLIAPPLEA